MKLHWIGFITHNLVHTLVKFKMKKNKSIHCNANFCKTDYFMSTWINHYSWQCDKWVLTFQCIFPIDFFLFEWPVFPGSFRHDLVCHQLPHNSTIVLVPRQPPVTREWISLRTLQVQDMSVLSSCTCIKPTLYTRQSIPETCYRKLAGPWVYFCTFFFSVPII